MIRRLLIACILLAGLVATAPATLPFSIARACSGVCISTTTSLSSTVSPSITSGTSSGVTLTASVSQLGGGTVGEGTVSFTSNGSVIPGCGSVALSGGQATCSTSITSEGDYSIEAAYSGSSDFGTSSSTLVQTVFNHTTVTGNTYCNSGSIAIPKSGSSGSAPLAANPYPSEIFVGPSGQGGVPTNGGTASEAGTISSVSLQLSDLAFTSPNDLDLMLSGPNGSNFDVMSNAGGTTAVSTVNLTLNDSAASMLPFSGALTSGTYRPTSWPGSFTFPAPAPSTFNLAPPAGTSSFATEFSNSGANGAWKLYAVTQSDTVSGSISGGWCLTFSMSATAVRASNFSYVRPDSRITFHWRVSTRAGIAGFAILTEPRSGKAHQLNRRLIPVHLQPDYAFTVRYGGPGPFRLQIISTSGRVLGAVGS
jgi:hypothetical protein